MKTESKRYFVTYKDIHGDLHKVILDAYELEQLKGDSEGSIIDIEYIEAH